MQKRSIEMLETLRKSAKRFSFAELTQFVADIKAATPEALDAHLRPPVGKVVSPSAKQTDPFVKRLNAIMRENGMKAPDGVSVLRGLLNTRSPATKAPAKASFPTLLKLVRESVSDEDVETELQAAAREFKARYSVRYDLM